MLTVPGVSSVALAGCLLQLATLSIMASGFTLMFGLRKIALRLGALAVFLVVVTVWSGRS